MTADVVFDRATKLRQRGWAVAQPESAEYEYLRRTVASRLVGRLRDITAPRTFPAALDMGCHAGHILEALVDDAADADDMPGGIRRLKQCDAALEAVEAAQQRCPRRAKALFEELSWHVAEEDTLATFCTAAEFDLVTSSLALHWVNDLPLALLNARHVLKPDGVFVGALLGESTLTELKHAFAVAEEERLGGRAPHCAPSTRVSDCGALLQRAGFNLITVDVDRVVVDYADPFVLLDDLQRMGEQHAPVRRPSGAPSRLSRDTLLAMAAAYHHFYPPEDAAAEGGGDSSTGTARTTSPRLGGVRATFEVIYMIGWAPSASQPRPLARGSARAKIGDLEESQGEGEGSSSSPS